MRIRLLTVVLVAVMVSSCAGGRYLRTQPLGNRDGMKGPVTLIMHGGKYFEDLETVALFDIEGDGYRLKPFSPEFRYKAVENLPAEEAFEKAYHFLSLQTSFTGTWLKQVLNERGEVIGYELRPVYMPFVYGEADVIDIHYSLREGGEVRVTIRLKERVERRRMDGGGDFFIWGN